MDKLYLTKLATLVNTQKQWEAFNELLEDRVGQYQKVLEQSVSTTELYQAQGAIQERITKMEERVDNAVVMVDESGDIIRDVRSDLKGDIDSLQADMDAADRRNRELDKEVNNIIRL